MTYFQNIHSLAELKKQYRALAIANHPDKGGSTEIMQQINAEFTRLHALWKDDTSASDSASGYENDYAGATAEEYADYVYNEYRWTGSNYKGQRAPEVVELLRQWLKETYPRYKFSVRRTNYNSIHICGRRVYPQTRAHGFGRILLVSANPKYKIIEIATGQDFAVWSIVKWIVKQV